MLRLNRPAVVASVVLAAVAIGWVRRSLPPSGAKARALSFGGLERSYILYAGAAAKKSALVLVLHGMGGNGVGIERRTKRTFDKLADWEGFVVVYPDAAGPRWNDGAPAADGRPADGADDVGFLSALIDSVSKEYGIDAARVYATGLSNGASMVHRLACERDNKIAAIAAVSGFMTHSTAERCKSGRPIPVLIMHGTSDPIIPYDTSVPDPLSEWRNRDGCPAVPDIHYLPDTHGDDGARVRVEHYAGCRDGSEVALYAIEGGGHTWPGGDFAGPFKRSGNTCRDIDAGVVVWDFFKRHAGFQAP
jgi:polyhydroxybutyrate depolymerase